MLYILIAFHPRGSLQSAAPYPHFTGDEMAVQGDEKTHPRLCRNEGAQLDLNPGLFSSELRLLPRYALPPRGQGNGIRASSRIGSSSNQCGGQAQAERQLVSTILTAVPRLAWKQVVLSSGAREPEP